MKRAVLALVLVFAFGCGEQATPTFVPTLTPSPTPTPVPTPTPTPLAPVDVVEKVVEAMATLDVEEASEFFCQEAKADFESSLTEGFEELEAMGIDPNELLDAFKLNLKDMKYEEKSKDGDKAVVYVAGSMSLDFDTEKLRSFFKKAAEAAGQQVTDQELDLVVNIFASMSGQEAPVDGDVELVKEDGDWKVCGELGFLDSSDLFELPLP